MGTVPEVPGGGLRIAPNDKFSRSKLKAGQAVGSASAECQSRPRRGVKGKHHAKWEESPWTQAYGSSTAS